METHTVQAKAHCTAARDWGFTGGALSQAGMGEQLSCPPASSSLMGLCLLCTSVFDLQGTGRCAKAGGRALEKRVLELEGEDSEEGQLPWFNALFLPRFFVLLLPPRSRCTKSLRSGSEGSGLFPWLCVTASGDCLWCSPRAAWRLLLSLSVLWVSSCSWSHW